ncbi:calaxin-like isoform X1 [Halichondria panicea]|uniref:calaxin-like isoform X1 n=1 Tax=Halichondria panicea TaxID=6063 RepID=UPI00312B4065
MATLPTFEVNAVERKHLFTIAEQIDKKQCSKFSRDEIEQLLYTYRAITGDPNGRIDRIKFRDLLQDHFHMSDDFFMDRVFRAFDKDSDGYLSHEEWVVGMTTFIKGDLDSAIEYCFGVYDLNDDGYISREEMFQMLKNTMPKQLTEEDPDEGIKEIVEGMVKRMDHDNDSKVSLEDFKKSIENERLLIEAFGPCLPDSTLLEDFSAKIFNS